MPVRRVVLAVAVLAVVLATLLLREPTTPDDPAADPDPTASPSAEPATPADFCAAYTVLVAAHSNHLTNGTDLSRTELRQSSGTVLDLEPRLELDDATRTGLRDVVTTMRRGEPVGDAAADDRAAAAFSDYLEVSCSPGGTSSEPQ